mgnify:FL=1
MKFPGSEIGHILGEGKNRRNLASLLRYVVFLIGVILLFSGIFRVLMERLEGETYSWVTAIYWTLVTMTTLGYGELTFSSGGGQLFSIVVVLSGVVLLLVVLPFAFIRFFYAPWLEAQLRLQAPRSLPNSTQGHVIISRHDEIAAALIQRLGPAGIPHCVVESDPAVAAQLLADGVDVIAAQLDERTTYEQLQLQQARLLFANSGDTRNSNIALTAREVSDTVPIVGVVESEDSIDVLEFSGCTQVLPLKTRLGQYLASRVSTGLGAVDVVGHFHGLQIAEFAARNTELAGHPIRDTHLRARTGLNIVGTWRRGRLSPALPETVIAPDSLVVVVGTTEQLAALDGTVSSPPSTDDALVLVIGAGKVGRAASAALKRKNLSVHVIDRSSDGLGRLTGVVDQTIEGDAADRTALMEAGLEQAQTVLLTTHDDAMNIYLSVYCRRLKPDLRIVSRISHDRNLEAIHRAGADFVLSYAALGAEAIVSILEGHELVILGQNIELFSAQVPPRLEGRTLAESQLASLAGLSVVAIKQGGQLVTQLHASTRLESGMELFILGGIEQRRAFAELFK